MNSKGKQAELLDRLNTHHAAQVLLGTSIAPCSLLASSRQCGRCMHNRYRDRF